ncbi:hypothetical protein AVEN_13171-1 [Araneus ventricosus]|uniref:Uncharacterized protein n=1 Tax=Araneus ventricosus TaxID=182803 RepID=A0A4Y2WPN3_ARAVE|nr:hypothetical protein AVEN_13171-1 [Araneus ventricosus]
MMWTKQQKKNRKKIATLFLSFPVYILPRAQVLQHLLSICGSPFAQTLDGEKSKETASDVTIMSHVFSPPFTVYIPNRGFWHNPKFLFSNNGKRQFVFVATLSVVHRLDVRLARWIGASIETKTRPDEWNQIKRN